MSFDLTNKNISDTFQNLLQKTGSEGRLYDLVGNEIGDLRISGSLTAQQYIISSSVTNLSIATLSGSTAFGDSSDDKHIFSGSVYIGGSNTSDLFIEPGNAINFNTTAIDDFIGYHTSDYLQYKSKGHYFIGDITCSANISASGNVNIGTAHPAKDMKLSVTGDISMSAGNMYMHRKGAANTNIYFNLPGSKDSLGNRRTYLRASDTELSLSAKSSLWLKAGLDAGNGLNGDIIYQLWDSDANTTREVGRIRGEGNSHPTFTFGSYWYKSVIVDVSGSFMVNNGSASFGTKVDSGERLTVEGNISASDDVIANRILLPASENAGIIFGEAGTNGKVTDDGSNLIFNYADSDVFQVNDSRIQFEVPLDIVDSTDATDATGDTGALKTEGGASIAKKLYVGTDLSVAVSGSITKLASTDISVSGTGSFGKVTATSGSFKSVTIGQYPDADDGDSALSCSTAVFSQLWVNDEGAAGDSPAGRIGIGGWKNETNQKTIYGLYTNATNDFSHYAWRLASSTVGGDFKLYGGSAGDGITHRISSYTDSYMYANRHHNFGIGTSAPTVALQVSGSISGSGGLMIGDPATNYVSASNGNINANSTGSFGRVAGQTIHYRISTDDISLTAIQSQNYWYGPGNAATANNFGTSITDETMTNCIKHASYIAPESVKLNKLIFSLYGADATAVTSFDMEFKVFKVPFVDGSTATIALDDNEISPDSSIDFAMAESTSYIKTMTFSSGNELTQGQGLIIAMRTTTSGMNKLTCYGNIVAELERI